MTIQNRLPSAEQSLAVAKAFNPRKVDFKQNEQEEKDAKGLASGQDNVQSAGPGSFAIFRVKLLGLQPNACRKEGQHAKCGGIIYSTPPSGLGLYSECMKCGAWHVVGGSRKRLRKN